MATEAVWPGSGSAVSGTTPFGLYDTDSDFQTEAPQFATWCARRLGYPITAVELQDSQFYACLEESVSEYSAQVNQFNIRDNLLHLRGQSTSSNFTHKRVKPTLSETIFISEEYGQEVYWPPTPGRFIMFPSWLTHEVEANSTDETRISISGNITFRKK